MSTQTPTASDETLRSAEPVGDADDQGDTRQAGAETEDRAPEEAGYGYGV
ncbi:MAG TPA: hypothetical protein VM032_04400 [Vicinamibacterales bacterium]|nr:hypothetical protein [Vicinamibacterales bacterium]